MFKPESSYRIYYDDKDYGIWIYCGYVQGGDRLCFWNESDAQLLVPTFFHSTTYPDLTTIPERWRVEAIAL